VSRGDPRRIAGYNNLVTEAAERLDAQLASIRRDYCAGDIAVIDAADERITVLTEQPESAAAAAGRSNSSSRPA
jgi:hypothetical protein